MAFNSSASTLAVPGDALPAEVAHVDTYGGTNPLAALRYASDALASSDAAHRLMVVLSDGAWSYSGRESAEAVIGSMREAGVLTVSALFAEGATLTEAEAVSAAHGAERFAHLGHLGDLVSLVAEAVRERMEDGLHALGHR